MPLSWARTPAFHGQQPRGGGVVDGVEKVGSGGVAASLFDDERARAGGRGQHRRREELCGAVLLGHPAQSGVGDHEGVERLVAFAGVKAGKAGKQVAAHWLDGEVGVAGAQLGDAARRAGAYDASGWEVVQRGCGLACREDEGVPSVFAGQDGADDGVGSALVGAR